MMKNATSTTAHQPLIATVPSRATLFGNANRTTPLIKLNHPSTVMITLQVRSPDVVADYQQKPQYQRDDARKNNHSQAIRKLFDQSRKCFRFSSAAGATITK